MIFGIRRAVELTDFRKSLDGLKGIPIELALPYKTEEYLKTRQALPELVRHITKKGIRCQSVHAPQGAIADNSFMSWAPEVAQFTMDSGARVVVFHPEQYNSSSRLYCQNIVLQRIKELQSLTPVVIAVETFGGKRRVLMPSELVYHKLPMVLDVSHVREEESREMIKINVRNIVGIHLSAIGVDPKTGENGHHLPINDFCFEILDSLKKAGWNGVVTLEYLPWHHDRLLKDREILEKRYSHS